MCVSVEFLRTLHPMGARGQIAELEIGCFVWCGLNGKEVHVTDNEF